MIDKEGEVLTCMRENWRFGMGWNLEWEDAMKGHEQVPG